jgi:hypothetical protein
MQKAKKDVSFLNEYSKIAKERVSNLELGKVNSELHQLVKKKGEGGDKLVKAAAILLICPDPVTGAAALPLLAAAKIKSARKSSDLSRVYEGINKIASSFSSGEFSL